jgi:hypothetical protein
MSGFASVFVPYIFKFDNFPQKQLFFSLRDFGIQEAKGGSRSKVSFRKESFFLLSAILLSAPEQLHYLPAWEKEVKSESQT